MAARVGFEALESVFARFLRLRSLVCYVSPSFREADFGEDANYGHELGVNDDFGGWVALQPFEDLGFAGDGFCRRENFAFEADPVVFFALARVDGDVVVVVVVVVAVVVVAVVVILGWGLAWSDGSEIYATLGTASGVFVIASSGILHLSNAKQTNNVKARGDVWIVRRRPFASITG